jgi:alpha-tubulin suppressor-like RCC1 family protein
MPFFISMDSRPSRGLFLNGSTMTAIMRPKRTHRKNFRSVAFAAVAMLLAGCGSKALTPAYHTPVPNTAAADSAATIRAATPPVENTSATVLAIVPAPLSAGGRHTCMTTRAGEIRCWGGNESGQLGNGTTGTASLMVAAGEIPEGAAAVESGTDHTCAIGADGKVWCWGGNGKGQLGDGAAADRSVPAAVTALEARAVMLAAGKSFTCALTETGGVKCWGWNIRGQLGDGTFADRALPADVNGLSGGVIAIAAGDEHACALLAAGSIRCWGNGSEGQLGTGLRQISNLPVEAVEMPEGAVEIAAGGSYSCARTAVGKIKCWGSMGSLVPESDSLAAREVAGFQGEPVSIHVGSDFACALDGAGGVACWGANLLGQLGDGSGADSRSRPVAVAGLTGAAALTAGNAHACALLQNGGIACWGDNYRWQLGNLKPSSSSIPLGLDPAVLHYYYSGIEAVAPMANGPQKYPSLWSLTEGFRGLTAPAVNAYSASTSRNDTWEWDFILCATDQPRLDALLSNTQVSFIINYLPVSPKAILMFPSNVGTRACRGWKTVLSGWENHAYELAILFTFTAEVFDGEKSYPEGEYWQIILLSVKD